MKKVRSVLLIVLLLTVVALPVLAAYTSGLEQETHDPVSTLSSNTDGTAQNEPDFPSRDVSCEDAAGSDQSDTADSDDLASLSTEELAVLLDELSELHPETEEGEHAKWEEIAAVKNELVDRASKSDYHYTEQVTFDTLYEFIDNRLIMNEKIIYATMTHSSDNAEETIAATRQESERIEAFKATLPQSGDDAYSYWLYYWEEVLHETAPSTYVA